MSFFSPEFIGFYFLVLTLYYSFNKKYQELILLISSAFFIGTISIAFLVQTILFVLITYGFAILIETRKERGKKALFHFNTIIVILILNLVFFKYINFFIENLVSVLQVFKMEISVKTLKILTPIGISYYTFQAFGYLLQIYRGNEKLNRNIITFSNYFLFFPKLLSGPIEQSKSFFPQLTKKYDCDYNSVVEGFKLILWGAFKKLVIADRLAVLINGVYPRMETLNGNIFIFTLLIQPIHLYCDFSGYTDIALGIGKTFGFNLTDNFNRPFFSTSVTQFWQRWHISLSAWCNEFIFKRIIFKKRKWGKWAPAYAVFVTFLVIGIWHGPRWNYILLGVLQGIAINYEYFTKRKRIIIGNKIPKNLNLFISYIVVYLFFCFTLIFFNAEKVSDSLYFIGHIFKDITDYNSFLHVIPFEELLIAIIAYILVFVVEFRREFSHKDLLLEINIWPRWIKWSLYYILIVVVYLMQAEQTNFIYLQF